MFNYSNFIDKSNKENLQKLKKQIEEYDEEIFKTYNKKIYYIYNKRNRKILTEYGEITFTRREYKNKKTGEYVCFTDRHFGLQPNKNITYSLKNLIFNQISSGKTIKSIKDSFLVAKISPTSISRILNEDKVMYFNTNEIKKKLP